MKLSARQAAKKVGKSVPTITRAIKSGTLSAEKNEKGGYLIDPAELFRVYPEVTGGNVMRKGKMLQNATGDVTKKLPDETPVFAHEATMLREQIRRIDEMNARERKQLESQIEDLRSDRDKWQALAEKQADAVKSLTYRRKRPADNSAQAANSQSQSRRPLKKPEKPQEGFLKRLLSGW